MSESRGGRDSFEVVKRFLERTGRRRPGKEEIREILPALRDIHDRLMRVRSIAPTVDLSDRMWDLMSLAGFKAKPVRGLSFGRAAML